MADSDGVRSLRAIMFTDVVGYSALMREDEPRALALLARQRSLLPPLIASHGGTLHKEIGDGLLATFPSAVDALQCARTLQAVLAAEPFKVRIGLHLGDVLVREGDVFGDSVNLASRIEALAEPGGIVVSADIANAVRSQPGVVLGSLGPQALKNLGAPVEVFAVVGPAASAPLASAPVRKHSRSVMLAAVLALVVAAVALVFLRPTHESPGPVAESSEAPAITPELLQRAPASVQADAKSIAVLPFVNMSGDVEQEYFSDGITEELLNHLAQISELRVTARTSSFAFKGRQMGIPEIASALGVSHVLEGSVRRAGNTVRITAQLIRAADGSHLWSQTYDRPLDDIFRVQDEISAAVTQELKARLLHPATDRGSVNPEAYALYLQANHERELGAPGSVRSAEELLLRAVALDPRFVDAWSALAIVRIRLAGAGGADQARLGALAREAAQNALAIDPAHALTYARLSSINRMELGLEAAAVDMRRALELNNTDPEILWFASETLAIMGRVSEAVAVDRLLVARDPVNSLAHFSLGLDLSTVDRLPEAEAAIRKAIELNPERSSQHSALAEVLLRMGRIQEAARLIALEPYIGARLTGLAYLEYARGDRRASQIALEGLIDQFGDTMAFQIAEVHACRDEKDEAFRWLAEAERVDDMGLDVAHLSFCLRSLQDDPRWLPLLQRIGRDPERLARIPFSISLPAAG